MSSFTSTTRRLTGTEEDRALKARHAAMWASGSYPTVASEVVHTLGGVLVDALDIRSGERVLDVAAGTGTSALPAARRGAEVVATDLTPELLEVGRTQAAAEGVDVTWQTADAEALPFGDAVFDVTMSSIGVMFAPHHQAAADELVRVTRSGGRIGVLSWTPDGFIGQLFATMKPYAPPPPPGASPAPLWGSVEHVRELLGDRVRDLAAHTSGRCASTDSAAAGSSGTSSRRSTAPRSPSTGPSATTRIASPPSTPTWRRWATGSSTTASCRGSTSSSLRRDGSGSMHPLMLAGLLPDPVRMTPEAATHCAREHRRRTAAADPLRIPRHPRGGGR